MTGQDTAMSDPGQAHAHAQLLYGLIALQHDFVDHDGLIHAIQDWTEDRRRTMAAILQARGSINADDDQAIAEMVARHVARHGGSPEAGLAAISPMVPPRVRDELEEVTDPDTDATLTFLFQTPSPAPTEPDPDASTRPDPEAPTQPGTGANRHAAGGTVDGARPGADDRAGRRFRKLRRLDAPAGNLGVLWVSEDDELHREVALKQIQPRLLGDQHSRVRFFVEAEITGGLEHPNIVPIYSLGIDQHGQPFYAMRLIRGESLRQRVRRFHAARGTAGGPARQPDPETRNLEFRELLRGFIDACHAIAYAHGRGVVHRDIKPANIMMGKFGETLVIDWGLARPIDRLGSGIERADEGLLHPASASGSADDESGKIIGTPSYLPPEMAEHGADQSSTSGDVYSLGATLYVILTGQPPFRGALRAVLARVRAGDFRPPRKIDPSIPPALEAICLKAMSRDPRHRYASAKALAGDVERWLADEPVSAYREPPLARLARWARRHRTAVASSFALLSTACVALGIGLWRVDLEQRKTAAQKSRAEKGWAAATQARQRAEDNARLSRDLSLNLLTFAEDELPPIPGTEAVRLRMVHEALRTFGTLLGQSPADRTLRYQYARLHIYEANLHRMMNRHGPADADYGQAIRLLEALLAETGGDAFYRDRLAEALSDRSQLLERVGRLAEAGTVLKQALEHTAALRSQAPNEPKYRRTDARAKFRRSFNEASRGNYPEARRLADEAVGLLRGLLDVPQPLHPRDRLLLVQALEQQAVALRGLGQIDEALRVLEEERSRARELVQAPAADNNDANALCRATLEHALTLALRSDRRAKSEAEAELAEAVATWERLAGQFTKVPSYREWVGVVHLARAGIRIRLDQHDAAGEDLAVAQKTLAELVAEFPHVPAYHGGLGACLAEQGRLALARGDADAAKSRLQEALAHYARARTRSPDDAQLRREEAEVQTILARAGGPVSP